MRHTAKWPDVVGFYKKERKRKGTEGKSIDNLRHGVALSSSRRNEKEAFRFPNEKKNQSPPFVFADLISTWVFLWWLKKEKEFKQIEINLKVPEISVSHSLKLPRQSTKYKTLQTSQTTI